MAQFTKINSDEKFINLALNLARKNIGNSAENPMVGCVIVVEDNIIATGITSPNGRPHAEIVAINKVPNQSILSKATIYITLEPCCHFGKSGPCVDEIVKLKFKKVVICSIDPNPLVNGKAIELLRKNGIEVLVGIGEINSHKINQDFFKFISKNIPFISVKIATTLDGKIASNNFHSKWISCEKSRKFSHLLRAKHQAIMVGANTIIQDNPSLNCRILGLENCSPIQIVISNNLKFNFNENFFKENLSIKKILICSEVHQSNKNLKNWQINSQNQVFFLPANNLGIDIKLAMQKLHDYQIKSILVEGGSSLITQLIKQNLVDQIIWCRSSKIIGNQAIPAIGDLKIEDINQSINKFFRTEFFESGDDLIEIFNYVHDHDDECKN